MAGDEHDDLDDMLDEALDGFEKQQRLLQSQVPEDITPSSRPAPPPAFDPLGKRPARAQPRAGRMAFDPLAPRPKPAAVSAPAATASSTQPNLSDFALPPDIMGGGRMPPELAALLAEMEKAGLGEEPGIPGGGQGGGLADTLAAMAQHARSVVPDRDGGEDEDEDEEGEDGVPDDAMLRRLAEQFDGFADTPQMQGLVDSIMQQMLSKEVLYQPMKDIGARYPQWLAANEDKLAGEELERYKQQYVYIQGICACYEQEPDNVSKLIGLLQQMQQCGQPPQEIVAELAPGLEFDADGLPKLPPGAEGDLPPDLANCSMQ